MKNRFLAGFIALAFCFIIALPAHAQDTITPEKTALIKEFMKLQAASTNLEALMDQFLGQGLKQAAPIISQALLQEFMQDKRPQAEQKQLKAGQGETNPEQPPNIVRVWTPDEQQRLKSEADEATQRILAHVRVEFPKRVNLAELLDRVGVELYAKHFSDEEIKELIIVYKSPSMQKLLRLLPQITGETLPKVQEWVTPTITKLMEEAFTEEKKKFKTK
jgi:hypothetical protein